MKILFLDVDGVLNCAETFRRAHEAGKKSIYLLDPTAIKRLQRIVKETQCKVVISSTWRNDAQGLEALEQAGVEFIDITPMIGSGMTASDCGRGKEVLRWLMDKDWKVTRYAILDDDPDFFKWQPLFQTSFNNGGLLDVHVDAVIKYFNKKPEQEEIPF